MNPPALWPDRPVVRPGGTPHLPTAAASQVPDPEAAVLRRHARDPPMREPGSGSFGAGPLGAGAQKPPQDRAVRGAGPRLKLRNLKLRAEAAATLAPA